MDIRRKERKVILRLISIRRIIVPIYEFQCSSCGANLELLMSSDDPKLPSCYHCLRSMNKIISVTHGYVKGTENHCFN